MKNNSKVAYDYQILWVQKIFLFQKDSEREGKKRPWKSQKLQELRDSDVSPNSTKLTELILPKTGNVAQVTTWDFTFSRLDSYLCANLLPETWSLSAIGSSASVSCFKIRKMWLFFPIKLKIWLNKHWWRGSQISNSAIIPGTDRLYYHCPPCYAYSSLLSIFPFPKQGRLALLIWQVSTNAQLSQNLES